MTGISRLVAWGFAIWALVLSLPACSGTVAGGKKAPDPATSASGRNQGPRDAPGIMRLGQEVYRGPIGPWRGEVRLIDLASNIEAAGAPGVRVRDAKVLLNGTVRTHHLAVRAVDPATGKPLAEGRGTVTVTGPAGERVEAALLLMEDRFGANLFLDGPGRYAFRAEIASGGRTGSAAFSHEIPEKPDS